MIRCKKKVQCDWKKWQVAVQRIVLGSAYRFIKQVNEAEPPSSRLQLQQKTNQESELGTKMKNY
jgi:hypothetical protein